MRVLVTGADGFIGRALVERLRAAGTLRGLGGEQRELVLLDRQFSAPHPESRIQTITGDMAEYRVLDEAVGDGVDCVFHLASVSGGPSEANFELGLRANLMATARLLETLSRRDRRAKFIFASTIGVYGVPLPARVDEATLPEPTLSYGAQKLMGEVLVTDCSRRGFIDGRSLRLPGIVARPPGSGMLSAFLSELIRVLSAGGRFVCPVSAEGMAWWMSRTCIVENLLHAAALDEHQLEGRRVWLLPVLHASLRDVVEAIAHRHGEEVRERVTYQPNPALQAQFASYPPLHCPRSVAAGFRHDGSVDALVERALDGP